MTEQSSGRRTRASNDILDATSFLSGANAAFIEGLYAQYLTDPDSLDQAWRDYFAGLNEKGLSPTQLGRGPAWRRDGKSTLPEDDLTLALSGAPAAAKAPSKKAAAAAPGPSGESVRATALDSIRAIQLVRAFRVIGHL